MRETDYWVNDSRLVINTKEIDLNLSIATGIETDVWCYVNDNPCILEPCNDSSYTGVTTDCCCGDIPLSGTNITGGTEPLPPALAIAPCALEIGDLGPAGGLVFWVDPNDPCRGYEVMQTNQASVATWCGASGFIGGTSQDLGTGDANTTIILANCPSSPAALACSTLTYGGYSDWFLPSSDELLLVYNNLNTLTHVSYWTSSEYDSGNAYELTASGVVSTQKKNITKSVRAIRYFDTNICNVISTDLLTATALNLVGEEYTECSWIYKFDTSTATTVFNGWWLAGMNDGTVGVFQQITTSGGTGTTIDYSNVINQDCCESYNNILQQYAWDTNKGKYYAEFVWDANCDKCKFHKCASLPCADFNDLLTTPITGLTTLAQFNEIISSELINARCRKISSSYPVLRALYERYLDSSTYCAANSSAFNYPDMIDFSGLVGGYWTDLFEQVVPSTTIWDANHIHGNTLYDQQKYKYRGYTLYPCNPPSPSIFPLTWTASAATDVDLYTITSDGLCLAKTVCSNVYYVTGDCGAEYLGTISQTNSPLNGGNGGGNGQIITSG
jgi:hypothetical protein